MEQKKGCELCGRPATMYCESDQASLCWVCDERVHSANFLVAKHTRRLLCQVCQSPTPWAAAGPKLGTTVSVCEGCFDSHGKESDVVHVEESRRDVDDGEYSVNEDGSDDEEEEDDEDELEDEESMEGDEYDDDEEEEEEEDGENQVVPWSCDSPPPPAASSSSSGEESAAVAGGGGVVLRPKRVWDIAFCNDSDDDIGCASSQGIPRASAAAEEEPSSASFRSLKQQRFGEENPSLQSGEELCGVESNSTSAAIIDSLKRLQKNAMSEDSSAATVLGICRLSRC